MRNTDRRRYEMLMRVRNFGAAHGQSFPSTSTAHEALAVITAEIAALETLDVVERSASQAARAGRTTTARKALVDCLTRAGHTGRVLAKTNPQIVADEDVSSAADDVQLLTNARGFAAKAAPLAEQFAAHGFPVSELEDHINRFESALHERGLQRDQKVRARAQIDASLRRALDAVETLDVTVANCLGKDAAALTVWKANRRLWSRRARNGANAADVESSTSAGAETVTPALGTAAGPQIS